MIGMKKGLFGKGMMPGVISGYGGGTFDMDGTQVTPAYSMPQEMNVRDGANLGAPGEQPRKGGGLKNVLLAALGGAADGASQFFGGQPLIAQNQQMQQIMAFRQAEEQRRRAAELADFRTQMQIRAEFDRPDAPKPGSFEWFQTAKPEQIAQYNSYMDITNPVMTTTWQGPTVIPRRPPVGARISMSDIGPEPKAPAAPSRPQSAAPATGARRITQGEYQRILRSMNGDQRRMNAFMAEQNILVGN